MSLGGLKLSVLDETVYFADNSVTILFWLSYPGLHYILQTCEWNMLMWKTKMRSFRTNTTFQVMRINYRLVYTIRLTNVCSTLGYRNRLNHQHRNIQCLLYNVAPFNFCVGKELQFHFDHRERKASWFGLMMMRVFNLILDVKNFEVGETVGSSLQVSLFFYTSRHTSLEYSKKSSASSCLFCLEYWL